LSIPVAIALGSNLGAREEQLRAASTELALVITQLRVSSFHDTEAVGVAAGQPRFLNAAAVGETTLSAHAVLDVLLAVELAFGRERPYPGAPRTIDLDLILYGGEVIELPGLTIPHPRFRDRRFVLEPLAELAPEWVDPVTGKTIAELLAAVQK
jgi:2-amino-4-hydroxy-6-hydroxymethyldihydropteridine diphosphokinase